MTESNMIRRYLGPDFVQASAVKVSRENAEAVAVWCNGDHVVVPNIDEHPSKGEVFILVPNGKHPPLKARPGDFVYRIDGKKYSVADSDVFLNKYTHKENDNGQFEVTSRTGV